MDFTFTEEQEAVAEAAAGVFDGMVTPARVAEIERTDDRVRRRAVGRPGPVQPAGPGRARGPRRIGPRPHRGLPGARAAGPGRGPRPAVGHHRPRRPAPRRLRHRPAQAAGGSRAWWPATSSRRAALTEAAASTSRAVRRSRPWPDGDGWRAHRDRPAVPQAHLAARVLVPARTDDGVVVVLVDPARTRASPWSGPTTTDRQVHPHLHLDGAAGGRGRRPGRARPTAPPAVTWMLERARTGLCAMPAGGDRGGAPTGRRLPERAPPVRPAPRPRSRGPCCGPPTPTSTRGHPGHAVAGGLAARHRPAGGRAVAVAKWWASEAGQRVVHATQHLHGGMGADVELPHPPLLPLGQADRAHARGPERPAGPHGRALAAATASRARPPAAA